MHEALARSWQSAEAWLVGNYVVMPDHVHLFCAPKNEEITIANWIKYWKGLVRGAVGATSPLFQARSFHHRLRREENYQTKWEYVRQNPTRAGLVDDPDDWPFQGELNVLPW